MILGLLFVGNSRCLWKVSLGVLGGSILYRALLFLALELGAPAEVFRLVSSHRATCGLFCDPTVPYGILPETSMELTVNGFTKTFVTHMDCQFSHLKFPPYLFRRVSSTLWGTMGVENQSF